MAWVAHITVAAVVQHDGRFLLVEERVEGQPVYNQPAGHLEAGETLHQAALRETLEETGLQFTPEHLIGIYHWQRGIGNETYIRVAFCGRVQDEPVAESLSEEIIGTTWLSYDEISALPKSRLRSPMVLHCIKDYLAGIRHPLSVLSHLNEPAERQR